MVLISDPIFYLAAIPAVTFLGMSKAVLRHWHDSNTAAGAGAAT
jgi:hypothetical protein